MTAAKGFVLIGISATGEIIECAEVAIVPKAVWLVALEDPGAPKVSLAEEERP